MTLAQAASSIAKPHIAPPNLRHARFEDYAQISNLETTNKLESQPESDWLGIWLNNPLWPQVKDKWPIGWVLEDDSGKLVGSITNVPSRYVFQGRELICANGRAWVAYPEYRSFALILMDEYFNQDGADLFINTTVGPMASDVLDELAKRVPVGDWASISYWITGYRGFARRALQKMHIPNLLVAPVAAALRLKDSLLNKSLRDAPGSVIIEQLAKFDSRFDNFWSRLVSLNPDTLLAVRDSAALAWHFAVPLRRNRLRIFTASRDGEILAYCILKRCDPAGGFCRMSLVDYQTVESNADLLPPLLKAALRQCAAENYDLLDLQGLGIPKLRAFDENAPYRYKLPNWPFYYRTNDPSLGAQLSQPSIWDPTLFDGDASFE